nr:MAG TPA: large terminase [Caudoviricetes sp.]
MPQQEIKISDIIIPKYMTVFNNRSIRHIILTSGRAGTKSSYAAIRSDFQIVSDPHASVVVLRKHHNKLRKTVYKEMIRGIKRLGLSKNKFSIKVSPMEISYKKTGATIYFSGSDGIDDTKGIIDEDKPIKLVVLDELTEFFDDGEGEDELQNIEATFIRGNQSGFQMVYLFNPPKNPNASIMEWVAKMEQRPDCIHIHTDYRDVPPSWLGPDLIESAEALREIDPKQYEWVWLGKCIGIEDVIYYMFSPEKHLYRFADYPDEEKRRIGEIGIGVDYGQQNPTTFEAFGIDYEAQKLRGIAEYYHSGRDEGKQRSPSEYAQDLKVMCDAIEIMYDRVVSYIFIDPSAAGLIEEVRRVLPHVTIMKAKNDVKLGISRVQKFLSFCKLLVSDTQTHLIKEFGLYQYDPKSIERGEEVPLKINDHCCDALRYLVMGMWSRIRFMLPPIERGEDDD